MSNNFINEREIAINTIMDIQNEELFNNLALKKALKNENLTRGQKGVITEIVNGVLRNKIYLEYCINLISKTNTNKMKPFILSTLLCSSYELLFMNTKSAFVCNEAVNLVKKKGFKNLAPFVNGVLRNIARGYEKGDFEISEQKDNLNTLSLKYSYPKWLVGYWNKYYGDATEEICKFLNTSPMVSVAINNHKTNRDDLSKTLESFDIQAQIGNVSSNSLLLKGTNNLANNQNFINGEFWVMDESSQKALEFIDYSAFDKNSVILDLCASPGGKSYFVKSNCNKDTKIISCDVFEHKLQLLEEGYKRLGFENYEVLLNDAEKLNDDFINLADMVIIDAPCSGFGLLRKKPDIKYSKTYEDILQLQQIQTNILDTSKNYVKDNGVLVYSTCTLSYLENEMIVEEFLKNNTDFVKETMTTFFPMATDIGDKKGFESDGFFVCILRKANLNG